MKIISPTEMACPRLELKWERHKENPMRMMCYYVLVLPGGANDVRKSGDETEARNLMWWTDCGAGINGYPEDTDMILPNGEMEVPYRDGMHARWDSYALRIPAYVVYKDKAMALESLDKDNRHKPNSEI